MYLWFRFLLLTALKCQVKASLHEPSKFLCNCLRDWVLETVEMCGQGWSFLGSSYFEFSSNKPRVYKFYFWQEKVPWHWWTIQHVCKIYIRLSGSRRASGVRLFHIRFLFTSRWRAYVFHSSADKMSPHLTVPLCIGLVEGPWYGGYHCSKF